VVTAWVVPDGSTPSIEHLRAHCAGLLAPYKQPRLIRVVDALPRNSLGKVVRGLLR
jgi:malonyl-CoA/methylmalonyl-CoA synthetase